MRGRNSALHELFIVINGCGRGIFVGVACVWVCTGHDRLCQ